MSTETTTDSSSNAADIDHDMLSGHSYDGIQEYDNPLPGWWKFLFWVSIIFAPIYYMYFHAGAEGRSIHDQYDKQMASIFELRFKEIGDLKGEREEILRFVNEDRKWLKVGEAVYKTNCTNCHGADGGGLIGPNLTDNAWKHVSNVEGIVRVLEQGAGNGAMPAWKNRLSHQNLIVLTAAYVASLRENPVEGKPPEGRELPPWSTN